MIDKKNDNHYFNNLLYYFRQKCKTEITKHDQHQQVGRVQ